MSEKKNIESSDIELNELFSALAKRWYWFVLFGMIGLGAGKWLSDRSKLIHNVQSVVLIEDNSERTVVADNDVPAFNLKYRTKDLESEIAILSSKDLMEKAVLETNAHITVFSSPELEQEMFHDQLPVSIVATPPMGDLFANVAVDLKINVANELSISYQKNGKPVTLQPKFGEVQAL